MIRTGTASILPVGTADLVRRRVSELGGIALLAFALLLSATLAGFNPGDPSFNHATDAVPTNLFGRPGAYLADLLLHGFGWAALVLAIGPAAWGWRLCRKLPVRRPALRAIALAAAMPAFAVALSRLPELPGVPMLAGAGGVVGTIGLRAAIALLGGARVDVGDLALVIFLAAALGILCFAYGAGLSFADWRQVARTPATIVAAGRRLGRRTAAACEDFAEWIDGLRWRRLRASAGRRFRRRARRSGRRGRARVAPASWSSRRPAPARTGGRGGRGRGPRPRRRRQPGAARFRPAGPPSPAGARRCCSRLPPSTPTRSSARPLWNRTRAC